MLEPPREEPGNTSGPASAVAQSEAATSRPRVMPQIDGDALNTVRISLHRYAQWLLDSRPLSGPVGQLLPEDLAGEAIMCAIENLAGKHTTRRWDPAACSMVTFCRGHIRSRVSNARTSQEQLLGRDTEGQLDDIPAVDAGHDTAGLFELRNLYESLRVDLAGDPFALAVLEHLLNEDDNSTHFIAARLQTTEAEVTNARQRIYRRGRKIAGGADE